MNEIICPNCKKAFKIDESGYAVLLKQVRDTEFQGQLNERFEQIEQQKNRDLELFEMKSEKKIDKILEILKNNMKEL